MRCYRADPRKWCHTLCALDILVSPQSPGEQGVVADDSADDSMATDGRMGGKLAMKDPMSFTHPAVREAVG